MANEVERMLDQLDHSYRADAWHGPAVLEALAGVDAARASARPLADAHSIWELVLHMAYWKDVVRQRLGGVRPAFDEPRNFPQIRDAGEQSWTRARAALAEAHAALREAIAGLDPALLEESPDGGPASRYVLVHGVIQHDLYHAGQIGVLKKGRLESALKGARRTTAAKAKARGRKPARSVSKKASKKTPGAGSGRGRGAAAARRRRA